MAQRREVLMTVFFEWQDAYELGLPDLDLQHTMIVNMLNELHAAMQSGEAESASGKTLEKLLLYVEEHFATEERAMRDNNFPGYEDHVNEHEIFREQVKTLHERHAQGNRIASQELLTILMRWFKDHIAEVDQEFGRHVRDLSDQAKKNFYANIAAPGEKK